jgi:hypothetical protein
VSFFSLFNSHLFSKLRETGLLCENCDKTPGTKTLPAKNQRRVWNDSSTNASQISTPVSDTHVMKKEKKKKKNTKHEEEESGRKEEEEEEEERRRTQSMKKRKEEQKA